MLRSEERRARAISLWGPAPGAAAGGMSSLRHMFRMDDNDDGSHGRAANARKVTPPPTARMGAFNRVTSTRRQVVTVPSQSARMSRSGGGAGAGRPSSREAALHPYTTGSARAGARPPGAVPPDSTSRQGARRSVSQPATTVRSTNHNYYPGMRTSQHVNKNVAKTRAGQTQLGMQPGVGLGMGMAGNRERRPRGRERVRRAALRPRPGATRP